MRGDFRLDDWLIQPSLNRVVRGDQSVQIEPKAMRVLDCLARHEGEVVSKLDLKRHVWVDTHVTDDALVRCISDLRKALADDSRHPRLIQTIPRAGYRLIGRVVYEPQESRAAPPSDTEPAALPVDLPPHPPKSAPRNRRRLILLLVVAGLILGLFGAIVLTAERFGKPGPVIRSLAVLPLENLSNQADQQYLAEAMTDALIADLSGIKTLQVVSRASVQRFKDANLKPSAIARQLRVDALLSGSVLAAGNRVTVNARLIDGRTDQPLWSGAYEREFGGVLFLQKEVARAVADEVRATLSPSEREQLRVARWIDPRAYEAYVKGRYFWNLRRPESLEKAISYFEEAIRLSPDFALAYSGLADAHSLLGHYGFRDPQVCFSKSKDASRKALALDGSVAEAHASLALASMSQDHNWAEAEAGFRRAIDLKPGYATAYQWLALCLAGQGRTDEAIAQARKAQELDPVSLTTHTFLAQCMLWARRYDEAIRQSLDALELHPDAPAPRVILAECYWRTGNVNQALIEIDKVKPLWRDDPRKLAVTRALFAGDRALARNSLADLLDGKLGQSDPMFCAQFNALLGNPDSAFRYLEAAYARHDSGLLVLAVDPTFDTLRSDPRFGSLVERMGFRRR